MDIKKNNNTEILMYGNLNRSFQIIPSRIILITINGISAKNITKRY